MTDELTTLELDVRELTARHRALDSRQRAIEIRFGEIMASLDSLAEDLKQYVQRSHKRAFVEAAAFRLLPGIYGNMIHVSQYDRDHMAALAIERAAALWEQIEEYFEPDKGETNDG